MSEALAVVRHEEQGVGELMRRATDVAGVCREIVTKTAQSIQGRKYVRVEGWQSIAVAFGCVASVREVEEVETGVRAVAEVRRISAGWETAWHMPGKDHIYSELGYELRANFSPAQALWEIANVHEQLLAAIAEGTGYILEPARFSEAAMPSTHEAQHTGWIRRWRTERGY